MHRKLALVTALVLAFAVSPAGAHNLTPAPTRMTDLVAQSADGALAVSGAAVFGGQRLLGVGTDPAGDTSLPPWYDLTKAEIAQLNPSTGDVTFVLTLADLPATGGVPETARYIWDFAIDTGGPAPVVLSIEGKFTDVVRNQSTRVPAFQLHGNCRTENNVITCDKVADLTAEMIGSDNQIFVDIPKSILEDQAKGSINGRKIVHAAICEGISAKVTAYFSLCGGSVGTQTGDTIVQDPEADVYTVAYRRVRVTLTPAGGGTSTTVEAVVGEDGSYSASVPTTGLAPGAYDVAAQACYGTNCDTATIQVAI